MKRNSWQMVKISTLKRGPFLNKYLENGSLYNMETFKAEKTAKRLFFFFFQLEPLEIFFEQKRHLMKGFSEVCFLRWFCKSFGNRNKNSLEERQCFSRAIK